MDKKSISVKDVVENIDTSFEKAFENDKEAKLELLRELGFNPEEDIKSGVSFIRQKLSQRKLESARTLRKEFATIVEAHESAFTTSVGQKAREAFERLFQSKDQTSLQLAFREFDKATDNDLKSILRDTEILRLLEEFRKNSSLV